MRIISGEFRGRKLVAPRGLTTRPTTDRVREAWFSMLGPLRGRVLDVYAGTGALGFEALSRGAEFLVCVESDGAAQRAIVANAQTLGVTRKVRLIHQRIEKALAEVRRAGPFDLILADPPWTDIDAAEAALSALILPELLASEGVVVLGSPRGRPLRLRAAAAFEIYKDRNWGDSAAQFLRHLEESESPT